MSEITETVVTFSVGDVASTGRIVHIADGTAGQKIVVLDTTAAHPVDSAWPDQGADRGSLTVDGSTLALLDVVVCATDGSGFFAGSDIPVKKGAEGWTFVVGHVTETDAALTLGTEVAVEIDPAYRRALSAGHTACHLASLALNVALADDWTKAVAADGRGVANFDGEAIASSRIEEFGSTDVYRLGKSLKKRGFDKARLLAETDAVAAAVNAQLAEWVGSGVAVDIRREGDTLIARRFWESALPGGAASIPCGGTHVRSLSELAAISVTLDASEDGTELTMRTTAVAS
ncbi:metal-dependent hydrolase [Lacisediminihabitans changchengi]|uniref:Metal-dependent hydrolase n=1 Tax=Lacisediminihabitans changchengi TaxID=2787634 RepID=A0A934VZA7_9MICO|nr:metal-dependent hydrolase [Lacisediminihabitans changchengi]MBK4348947.1 metal-dependent hydrolase [Lacisediminihabitans changchengi]